MAQTTLGIEIDRDRITVVECVGDMAVSMRTVSLDERSEAVDLALAGLKIKKTDPAIRVSLASTSMVARRIDVTAAMLKRSVFEDAVYTALPVDRETTCTAGMFFQSELLASNVDQLTPGVGAVAPRAEVDAAYRSMGDRRSEVVPSPFVFEGRDGLWLGLRYSVSDLTLVVNGHVIAYRQLRAGGLDTISGLLVDPSDPESGNIRLENALHRTGASDPVAESELDRWLRTVSLEVRQTTDFWTRSGEEVPSAITAYGTGSASVGLNGVLTDSGFTPEFPEELSRLMSFLTPADRPIALGAYLAAQTTGFAMPQAAFVDPGAAAAEQNVVRRNRRALQVGGAAIVLISFLGMLVVPTASAWLTKSNTQNQLTDARAEFAKVATVWEQISTIDSRRDAALSAISGEIDYATAIRAVVGTQPAGYTLSQVAVAKNESGEIVAVVSANKSGGSYRDLTRWLTTLRSRTDVVQAWSSAFSDREGMTSFQMTIRFSSEELIVKNRPLKEAIK